LTVAGAASTSLVASVYLSHTKIAVCYQHVSPTIVNCVALTKLIHGFVLSKGTQLQQGTGVGATQITLTRLSPTLALGCFVKTSHTRCKVLRWGDDNELHLEGSTVATVTNDGASYLSVTAFTNTTAVACYQGCAAAGCAAAARVVVCNQLTFVSNTAALTVGALATIFAGTQPTYLQVVPFSPSKGIVVWFNTQSGHVTGKGKVLTFGGDGNMAFPAAVFNFGTADAVLTYVTLTALDPTHGVVCYNEGGSTAKCQAIALNPATNTAAAAAVLSVQAVATSFLGVVRSDNNTARLCYAYVPPAPPGPPPLPPVLTCNKLELQDNDALVKGPELAVAAAGNGPTGVTTVAYDECSNLNCYLKTAASPAVPVAECVLSGADVVTVANGGSCGYYLNGYTCPADKCRSDVWDPTPMCNAGCRMSNIPATPSGGGNTATATCTSVFGACSTDASLPPLRVLDAVTPGLQAGTMFSDMGAGDKDGILCYKEAAGPTKCVAIKKTATALTKGSNHVVLHAHVIAENAFTVVRLSASAGFSCFNDANAANIGTCKAFAFASNEVSVASPAATFSATGKAVSVLAGAAFDATKAVVCFALASDSKGECRSLTYANQGAALAFTDNGQLQITPTGTGAYSPTGMAVSTYSATKGVVCFLQEGFSTCKALVLAGTVLTAPGVALSLTETPISHLHMAVVSATKAVVCYNGGGIALWCHQLIHVAAENQIVKKEGLAVHSSDTTHVQVARIADDTVMICANVAPSPSTAAVECIPTVLDGEKLSREPYLPTHYGLTKPSTGDYLSLMIPEPCTVWLCFHRPSESPRCYSNAINKVVRSSGQCRYTLQGYACSPAKCADGSWDATNVPVCLAPCPFDSLTLPTGAKATGDGCAKGSNIGGFNKCVIQLEGSICTDAVCGATGFTGGVCTANGVCSLSDLPDSPVLDGVTANATCTSISGTRLLLSSETATAISSKAFNKDTAIVCYTTTLQAVCYGFRKTGLTLIKGTNQAVLNPGATSNLDLACLTGTSQGIACFADGSGSGSNQGTCKQFAYADGEVAISAVTPSYLTPNGIAVADVDMAPFNREYTLVCYASPSDSKGSCRILKFVAAGIPLVVGQEFVFAGVSPSELEVTCASATKAVVCWMDATDSRCRVLVRDDMVVQGVDDGYTQLSNSVIGRIRAEMMGCGCHPMHNGTAYACTLTRARIIRANSRSRSLRCLLAGRIT